MSCCTAAGIRCQLPRSSRHHEPTPAQQLRHRNALWLFAVTIGLHDPVIGRVRPHTVREIASLFGVHMRTVQVGIADARKLKELAERA